MLLLVLLLLLLLCVTAVTIVAAKPQAALAEPSVAPSAVVLVLSALCSCQMFCRVPCCGTAEAAAHCLESGWVDN